MKRILYSIVAFYSLVSAQQTPYDSLYLKSSTYKNLTAMFELSKLKQADIVMLGNSITYGGNWNDLLGRTNVANRGIGGDNTLGTLHRMKYVYNLKPKVCCIMTGINDIYADAPMETIFNNYKAIIDTLRLHKITPIIQSTLHVNPKWKRADEKNKEVTTLDSLLFDYAVKEKIMYVNVDSILSTNGVLNDEYTTDGVHLTPSAYVKWRELLEPIFQKLKL